MNDFDFRQLVEDYITERLSPADQGLLFELLEKEEYRAKLSDILQEEWKQGSYEEENLQVAKLIEQTVMYRIGEKKATPVHSISTFKWSWVAAAAILILILGGGYLLLFNNQEQPRVVAQLPTDVAAPKDTRAVITMANGKKIYLDSANNGTLLQQDGVEVVKNNGGEIVYHTITTGSSPLTYNTLFNPRGSKVVSLTLADGTKVWLNSESSLKYPMAFSGNTRGVEITGEAYFEVAKDKTKKFIVTANGTTTEVLGTHFNVNSYADESDIKVTLLEGSVKVGNASGQAATIKPGEQARLIPNSKPQTTNEIDLQAVMAWKNGYFQFSRASLQQVLQQLTRWYDVEVAYEGKPVQRQFVGEMERSLSLAQVLKLLEKNGVKFRIEDKKIIVLK